MKDREDAAAGPSSVGAAALIVDAAPAPIAPEEILVVRRGPGANCSSIGSALDVLFLSATVAGVILVSVSASVGGARPAAPPREAADGAGPRQDKASDAREG